MDDLSTAGSLSGSQSDAGLSSDGLENGQLTSDLPDCVGSPQRDTICYGDIDLFILRNPEKGERDVIVAIVEFRNLKGRAEGTNG